MKHLQLAMGYVPEESLVIAEDCIASYLPCTSTLYSAASLPWKSAENKGKWYKHPLVYMAL